MKRYTQSAFDADKRAIKEQPAYKCTVTDYCGYKRIDGLCGLAIRLEECPLQEALRDSK